MNSLNFEKKIFSQKSTKTSFETITENTCESQVITSSSCIIPPHHTPKQFHIHTLAEVNVIQQIDQNNKITSLNNSLVDLGEYVLHEVNKEFHNKEYIQLFKQNDQLSSIFMEKKKKTEIEGYLKFEVLDTGIGIDLHEQANIFKMFTQANKEINIMYGGSGVGLYSCKQLAEILNGDEKNKKIIFIYN
ncbi:hypothetical protein IMG5_047530 [Ichthyophthirius multifiliis]|uniref:histidine kinase n=1 Tax=Ichthyophthirius multifiliis TaxID=5932 RepID=G0QMC2_ICHMU|nr:hypothetical protein IMG5_047530 [Ichthyophthirius multifiliis]EGR33644.1 hypothetical protein IMG5_047530 [Ichthyophthirius multifiliis]|eukprot:XP_004037630.1 hypothetical protein IMG5_047530 [Ichthyophthirius multifiliis]